MTTNLRGGTRILIGLVSTAGAFDRLRHRGWQGTQPIAIGRRSGFASSRSNSCRLNAGHRCSKHDGIYPSVRTPGIIAIKGGGGPHKVDILLVVGVLFQTVYHPLNIGFRYGICSICFSCLVSAATASTFCLYFRFEATLRQAIIKAIIMMQPIMINGSVAEMICSSIVVIIVTCICNFSRQK